MSLPNTVVYKNGTITNSGALSGTGLLQTQGPVTVNSSGSITVPLEVVSGTTTAGGNFGQVTIDPGATLLQNANITENGNFVVNGTLDTNHFFEFQGTTFTNNGSIIDTTDTYGEIDFNGVAGSSGTTQAIAGAGVYAPGTSFPMEIHIVNATTVTPVAGTVLSAVRNFFIAAGSTLSLPNTLVFKNGAINNSGAISGAGMLQTQSSVTLNFTGSTTAPLEVVNGTTTGIGNFGQVTIDNGATLLESATITENGNLTVASGGTVDMNNQYLFFQGTTFTNNGAFTSSVPYGEFRFNGINGASGTMQNVAGTGTYNTNGRVDVHLINGVTVTPASGTVINGVAFLTIEAGSTLDFIGSGGLTLAADVSNSGTIRLNGGGTACGDTTKIVLRSSVLGTQRAWSGAGTFSMTDVDVQDQAGSAAIIVTGGIDSGNNGSNWTFATCGAPTPTPSPTPPSTPTPTPTGTPIATPTPTPGATPTPSGTPQATPSQLLNIATRMRVQTGDNVLIGGFIITGTDPKRVIIRGIGPSLSSLFTGALADPTLELFQGSTSLAMNDNWRTDQEAEIVATGIPPTNDLESAIVRTLTPGSYTAILRGKNDTTGIGVVEAYDLDRAANSRLANIATRGFVETGDNVMIGGLIIGPADGGSARVVVRAIGPSLGNVGISGALQDPTLDLVDSNGVIIRSNNNWRDSQEAEIIATGLAPTDDRESALVQIVAPGSYTAIVRGVGTLTGVALVEVYQLQ